MKRVLTMAIAVLLVTGTAFAGGKNCEKSCAKKEGKSCQKEGKTVQKEKKAEKPVEGSKG